MQGARSRAMEPVKSRDRCASRRTPRLKIFHGAEDFRSVHGRWPFGQTFSNGTSNTAKCLLSGKCTFNCTSKSKRQPLGSRACIVTRGAAYARSRLFSQPSPPCTHVHTYTHTYPRHPRTHVSFHSLSLSFLPAILLLLSLHPFRFAFLPCVFLFPLFFLFLSYIFNFLFFPFLFFFLFRSFLFFTFSFNKTHTYF